MKKEVIIALIVIVVLVVLMGIWQFNSLKSFSNTTSGIKECAEEEDCVPASCCHASSCVKLNDKLDCSEVFCSQSCEPGTLDCEQGSCKCLKNKCVAVLK